MNIFELPDGDNFSDKINLDELYDKKREYDESKLVTYNKILNRVHARIKSTSRQSIHERCCWYIIPEIMIGITRYNVQECTSFLLSKLADNGFNVKYTHPNLLFICWHHWIPDYVRKEMKKQTGVEIDGYGNEIQKNKGGLMSSGGKKISFAMTTTPSDPYSLPNSQQKQSQQPRGSNTIVNNYGSEQYPPQMSHTSHQQQQPSLNNLTLSSPTQVRDSYKNPLINHTPFDAPSQLKYDPNNHQVSYEPYKMNYMTSTSTKNDDHNHHIPSDTQIKPIPQQQQQQTAQNDMPSSKRDPPEYKSVRTYKPSGIYNAEMFSQLKSKLK